MEKTFETTDSDLHVPPVIAVSTNTWSGYGGKDQHDDDWLIDDSSESNYEATQTTPLEGNWVNACELNPMIGLYSQETLFISGLNYRVLNVSFADEACRRPVLAIDIAGTFTIGEQLPANQGNVSAEQDITIENYAVTPLVAERSGGLNATAACDRTDWETGVSFDVSGCARFGAANAPGVSYGLFLVENDVLYTGPERAPTPETRPMEVDLTNPYKRFD